MTSSFAIVGTSPPRPDGAAKVSGSAQYFADIDIPGSWIAGVLRSPVPAGRLKTIRKDPAFDWNTVTVITASDLPGPNVVGMIRDDYEILAADTITYATQALALVAAPDAETLALALAALSPDIEPETPALTVEDALAGVAKVWGEDNVMDEYHVRCGDVEQGFREADVIVENIYRTGYQEHIYLETQAMAAWPRDGGVEVAGSLQCPYYVHKAVARALGLDAAKVAVRQTTTGGAFGGKEEYPSVLGVWVALLAQACGRPVRLIYDRAEDMLCTTKRHPSKVTHRMGLKRDGTITAVDIDLILDGGANTTMSKVVLARSILHATGAYKTPHAAIRARAVATNTPPNGAFRGFGAPQSLYAMERQMDLAAAKLGLNPYDIRMKNVLRGGDAFPYGQVLSQEDACGAWTLEDAVKRSDYLRKHKEYAEQSDPDRQKTGRARRGVGLSLCLHGGGFTGSGEDNMGTTVEVEYRPDGVVELLTSITDMGQGAETVLPMIAAEALGLPLDRVRHPLPDTSRVPNSGPTVASRSTMFVGRVVFDACADLVRRLAEWVAARRGTPCPTYDKGVFRHEGEIVASLDLAAADWLEHNGRLSGRAVFQPDPNTAWDEANYKGSAYKGYAWMAQVVEVETDLDTYEVRPLHATLSVELGRAINPLQVTGQMEGGVLQSYGGSYMEDLTIGPDGAYSAGHLNAYLIPTSLDAPSFDLAILEQPCPVGPYGAKGIGELPMDGGAPAFAAAVENACGVFACESPITGEKLFRLLESAANKPVNDEGEGVCV